MSRNGESLYGPLTIEEDGSYSSANFRLKGTKVIAKAVSVFLEIEARYMYSLNFECDEEVKGVFRFPWRNSDHIIYWCEITQTGNNKTSASTIAKCVQIFEAQTMKQKVEHNNDFQMFYKFNPGKYTTCEIRVLYVTRLQHDSAGILEYILPELANDIKENVPIKIEFSVDAAYADSLKPADGGLMPGLNECERPATAIPIRLNYGEEFPCSLLYCKGRTIGGFLEKDIAVLTLPRSNPEEEFGKDLGQGEFIFCVDRSASMGGDRIKHAKETLLLFLKSLPVGCHFNIFSFGSSSSALFGSGSQEYNENTLKLASQLQESMGANMGGTNLTPALKDIYSRPPVEGKFRAVFVITDGGIWDTDAAVDLVRKNADKTIVCAFGVGEGADRNLVQSLAEAGGGQQDFVSTTDRSMETKIMEALQWVTIGGNRRAVTSILPNGMECEKIITMNTDERTEVHFAVLKGKAKGRGKKSHTVTFKFSLNNETTSLEAEIPKETPSDECRLPLHVAAAGEALNQNVEIPGISREELWQKINIFLPEVAVRTETFVVRAPDLDLTEHIGVSLPEEIEIPPSPPVPPAPTFTPRLHVTTNNAAMAVPKPFPTVLSSSITDVASKNIKKTSLIKIARRAGVGRFSSLVFEEARHCLVQFLEQMVKDSILYAENGKRKTVTETDVDCALKKNGVKMFGVEDYAPYAFESNDKKSNKTRRGARRRVPRTWPRTTPIGRPDDTSSIASILGVDTGSGPTVTSSKGVLRKKSIRTSSSESDNAGNDPTCSGTKATKLAKRPTVLINKNSIATTATGTKESSSRKRKSTSITSRSTSITTSEEPTSKISKRTPKAKGKGQVKNKIMNPAKGKQPLKKNTRSSRRTSCPGTGGGFQKDFTVMIQLISLQNFDGSWDLGLDLAKILKYTKEELIDKIPDLGEQKVTLNQWATILAMSWLHKYYAEQQTEWEMIGYKAREYVGKGFSENPDDLTTLKEKATGLFP